MPEFARQRVWKVGLTVVAGVILFYLGILWAQRASLFEPEDQVFQLSFDSVNGLLVGDPVTVRGFMSGRVTDIVPGSEDVMVAVALDPRIQLRSDARAEIQIKELMGGKQIAIFPGESPEMLAEGSLIPGRASLDFSSSFSEFGQVIEQVNVAQMNTLLARLDTFAMALNRISQAVPAEQIRSLMARLDRMTADLEQASRGINEAELVQQLDESLDLSQRMLRKGDSALERLLRLSEGIEPADIEAAGDLLQRTDATLESAAQLLSRVETIMDSVGSANTLVGQALLDPSFAQGVDSTLRRLQRVLAQIEEKRIIVGLRRKRGE